MTHYFTNQETPYTAYLFKDMVLDSEYSFYSSEGVFSKNKIDYGSKVLIKSLVDQGQMKGKMLDIGSGLGALSLVLAALNPELSTDLIDVNKRAIELANLNITHFNLEQRLSTEVFDLNTQIGYKDNYYDYVLTNPPIRAGKATVQSAFDLAYRSLKVGGSLYVVIQKKQGAPSAKKYIENIFGRCNILTKSKGYFILSVKRTR